MRPHSKENTPQYWESMFAAQVRHIMTILDVPWTGTGENSHLAAYARYHILTDPAFLAMTARDQESVRGFIRGACHTYECILEADKCGSVVFTSIPLADR